MFKQWLSRLETVHRAETREELEAVYRFRYSVYVEEFGRELGSPDHRRKWVTDDDDEKSTTSILYTGSPEKITGTVRLRHWQAGSVPRHDREELSMERFPDLEQRNTAEIGRLMVQRSMRGKLVIASLLRASYELLTGEQESDLVFCYCSPGLVRYYQQLAMRPYGGQLIAAPDGLMVPLVSVVSDYEYFRRARSLFAPMVKRYFGPGKREPLDLTPYQPLFAPGNTGVELDPERVVEYVEEALARNRGERRDSALSCLPSGSRRSLIAQGLVLDVPDGALVTRKGFGERELYVVLEGWFEAAEPGYSARLERGDLFGEDAFLDPEGRRAATIRAHGAGKVLVLRGRTVEKLARQKPAEFSPWLGLMARTLAERTSLVLPSTTPARLPETTGVPWAVLSTASGVQLASVGESA